MGLTGPYSIARMSEFILSNYTETLDKTNLSRYLCLRFTAHWKNLGHFGYLNHLMSQTDVNGKLFLAYFKIFWVILIRLKTFWVFGVYEV